MPITETEFDDFKVRLARTETSVEQLVSSVSQVVGTQQQQQQQLGALSSDMQSILTLLKTRDGRLDIKLMMSVIGGLGVILLPLGAMFLAPLKTQVDNIQQQVTRDLGNTRDDVDELRKNGAPSVRADVNMLADRQLRTRLDVDQLQLDYRRRLETEAEVGRRTLYGTGPATIDSIKAKP